MIPDRPDENCEPKAARHTDRSSCQFSIRAMMIATAVIAVLCCIFFTLPIWVGGLFLLIVVLLFTPAILAALIYGSGRTRAFAVGASPLMCIVFLWFTFMALSGELRFLHRFSYDYFDMRVLYALVILVVVLSGFVAQAVRWWCMPRDNRNDTPP